MHPLTRPGREVLLQQIMSSQIGHCFGNLKNIKIIVVIIISMVLIIK